MPRRATPDQPGPDPDELDDPDAHGLGLQGLEDDEPARRGRARAVVAFALTGVLVAVPLLLSASLAFVLLDGGTLGLGLLWTAITLGLCLTPVAVAVATRFGWRRHRLPAAALLTLAVGVCVWFVVAVLAGRGGA